MIDPWLVIGIIWLLAIGVPAGLHWSNQRTQRRERAEDFARQDRVAELAAETARKLQEAQQLTIAKTDEVAAVAASAAKLIETANRADVAETHFQLSQIHTLVNSEMTAARQEALDQTRLTLMLMRKIADAARSAGQEVTVDELAAIERTEGRIIELEAVLSDRMTKMRTVEAEVLRKTEEDRKL